MLSATPNEGQCSGNTLNVDLGGEHIYIYIFLLYILYTLYIVYIIIHIICYIHIITLYIYIYGCMYACACVSVCACLSLSLSRSSSLTLSLSLPLSLSVCMLCVCFRHVCCLFMYACDVCACALGDGMDAVLCYQHAWVGRRTFPEKN